MKGYIVSMLICELLRKESNCRRLMAVDSTVRCILLIKYAYGPYIGWVKGIAGSFSVLWTMSVSITASFFVIGVNIYQ